MPLNENAINEILPFATDGSVIEGDLMSLDEYIASNLRRKGHQTGVALRSVFNRQARQTSHITAGVAQFIANQYPDGVVDDGDIDKVEAGIIEAIKKITKNPEAERLLLRVADKYDVGEFYYFRHPTIKPGFAPLQGGLISGAYQGKNITEYPIWAYLQTTDGQLLCKTEAQWQAMTTATWATLADGTTVGWGGIGGAPFYVQDLAAGTLRMPDVRGMYAEAAGFDSLGVGGVHGDAIRQIFGNITGQLFWAYWHSAGDTSSAMYISNGYLANVSTGGSSGYRIDLTFSASRRVPTATKNQPRAWGALACCYLGQPAS